MNKAITFFVSSFAICCWQVAVAQSTQVRGMKMGLGATVERFWKEIGIGHLKEAYQVLTNDVERLTPGSNHIRALCLAQELGWSEKVTEHQKALQAEYARTPEKHGEGLLRVAMELNKPTPQWASLQKRHPDWSLLHSLLGMGATYDAVGCYKMSGKVLAALKATCATSPLVKDFETKRARAMETTRQNAKSP